MAVHLTVTRGKGWVKYCGAGNLLSTKQHQRLYRRTALHPPIAVQGATHVDLLQCTYWHKLWRTQCTVRRGCSQNACTASNRRRFFATAPLANNAYILPLFWQNSSGGLFSLPAQTLKLSLEVALHTNLFYWRSITMPGVSPYHNSI